MNEFNFKEGGQLSSVILLTCKVKKKIYMKEKLKDYCVDKKWHSYACKKKKYLYKKYKHF